MAKVVHVLSPNGQHKCAGEYTPVDGELANGQPVWQQAGGSFWLYSGINGMWIIGAQDVKEKGFQCNHGNLFCRTLHSGTMPAKVNGSWHRLDGDDFVEDEDITIVASISKPFSLRLVSPNGPQRCTGEYQILGGEMANGMPIWRHRGGKLWLYAGINGTWIVGATDAKEKNFKCNKGVIYSKRAHGGLTPERVSGVWVRLDENEFEEDLDIKVGIKPAPLYLEAPRGQQRCAGEYIPVADKMANGYPIWEHIGGKCWIYSGTNGMWIVGGGDAKAKNFQCTRGVIYCKTPHGGLMPEKLVGSWLRLEGESFRADATISVSVKPAMVYLITPSGQQKCSGEYRLVAGESVNGQPVWKQKKGIFRIYSSRSGCWQIAGNEKFEHDFKDAESIIRCEVPHEGMMPDKVRRAWRRLDGEEYVDDPPILVSTVLYKPAKLHVKTPNGQQRCAGEYVLVAGNTANGQPLWRQMGGKYWLYSGTNGMWIFGSNGAKEKSFECSRGVIYSNHPHGGVMPDKLQSLWLRLDGEAFHEDAAIIVGADHGTRKRGAAAIARGEPDATRKRGVAAIAPDEPEPVKVVA
mmetsp:Transcript_30572/g.87743  ORF Transcript_30572/g.87743 Transcript_30572/m.87743 type:complete len:577 (-) Transcript_30572:85-1815(-)